MWRQKVKTRNWCWRKNWCHHKNHLFAPEGRATPRHSVSSQGLRILLKGFVSACSRFLFWNFISFWITESMFLPAWSIIEDGRGKEMVQKENNILIDETRTDLRQGFHRIHSSSSFVPHPSFSICRIQIGLYHCSEIEEENTVVPKFVQAMKLSLSLASKNCKFVKCVTVKCTSIMLF